MSTAENKAIVLKFYQAFDNRNIEQALDLLAPNFIAHLAGIPESLNNEDFKQFGMRFYSTFTDSQHQFDEVIVAGNKVVTCGTFTARHTGEFQNLPPTDKQIKISMCIIDIVENGKIIEHWGQGDAQGLMQQLGILFFPSPKLIFYILKNICLKFLRDFR
jgi:predicted ester cyclase